MLRGPSASRLETGDEVCKWGAYANGFEDGGEAGEVGDACFEGADGGFEEGEGGEEGGDAGGVGWV